MPIPGYPPDRVAPNVHDGDTVLDFFFKDFGAGESLLWYIDVDAVNGGRIGTILGHELIDATAYVDFSNGERLFGTLGAVPGAFTVRIETAADAIDAFTVPAQAKTVLIHLLPAFTR